MEGGGPWSGGCPWTWASRKAVFWAFSPWSGGVFGLGLLEKSQIGRFTLVGGGGPWTWASEKGLVDIFLAGEGSVDKEPPGNTLEKQGVHQPRIPQTNLEADLWMGGLVMGKFPKNPETPPSEVGGSFDRGIF